MFPLARVGILGGLLLALAGATLWAEQMRHIDWFVWLALTQGAVYLAALKLVRKPPGRGAFTLILLIAVALRMIAAASPVLLSTDINRYVWDGRVQAAGINPYRYVPNDPALTALRDPVVWPNINRASKAHTIYPPAAQMIFLAAQALGSSVAAMKCMMLVLEAVGIFAIVKILDHLGRPRDRIVAYVWHPLPIWEIAGAGHIDAALIAFIPLALWAWLAGRKSFVGIALAAATLIKFFPLILAPGLWGQSSWVRRDFRLPAIIILLAVLAYLPYLGVGAGVFGFVSGYAKEEQLGSGSGFWLVDAVRLVFPLPVSAYLALGAGLLAWLEYRAFIAPRTDLLKALVTLGVAFTFFASPHYAWYFLWLIPLLTVTSRDYLLWPTLTAVVLYWAPTPSQAPLWIGAVIYGGTGCLSLFYLSRGQASRLALATRN